MSEAGGAHLSRDVIRVEDEYYIRATSSLADARTRVLKRGETFAVLDRVGDVHPVGRGEQGLFHDGTRFLSHLELRLGRERPVLLSSTLTEDGAVGTVDLTNPTLPAADGGSLAPDRLHLHRATTLSDATAHQRLRVRSYAFEPAKLELRLLFAADFADLFEVRGVEREKRGEALAPELAEAGVVLGYRGLDGLVRRTRLAFAPAPDALDAHEARYRLRIGPGEETAVELEVRCELGEPRRAASALRYEEAAAAQHAALTPSPSVARIETSNEQFNDWLNRSAADLRMMCTPTPYGPYPYAGVPWFNAPFGRDGLVTALETLWVDPAAAAGVLRFLAATQATEAEPESDAEPGKILHEARGGEMALLGEIPFRRYYGTVDATPLFVLLAHACFERTGDAALVEELWPSVERALDWMERFGDRDGDGLLEYERSGPRGLANQGWKDSPDAVSHADGTLARGPIALCEVQAYAFGALRGGAELARARGEGGRAAELEARAEALRARFEEQFWCEELGSYALALDGEKRPCRVRSSNAGQCLLTGIASPERAARVAETLMAEESFSGWGVRTLASSAARYNPMSYHNGSVWPHDGALVALGLARYGLNEPLLRILAGLFDATLFLDLNRLPELFCGFPRRAREGPTLYPVACAPQSWAAGAVYALLQACLGLSLSARERRVLLHRPALPPFLQSVRLYGLRVGEASLDLALEREPGDVSVRILRREGRVDLVTLK